MARMGSNWFIIKTLYDFWDKIGPKSKLFVWANSVGQGGPRPCPTALAHAFHTPWANAGGNPLRLGQGFEPSHTPGPRLSHFSWPCPTLSGTLNQLLPVYNFTLVTHRFLLAPHSRSYFALLSHSIERRFLKIKIVSSENLPFFKHLWEVLD